MGAWKDVSKAVRVKTRATAYYLKEKNRRDEPAAGGDPL